MSDARVLANSGLQCPACRYDLSGLAGRTCPECGIAFDPIAIARTERRRRHRRWIVSALAMLIVMYGPYAWLLVIDYPWSDYRWSWIRMWPALPLLLVASLMRHFIGDVDDMPVLGALMTLSLLLWLALAWVARGARWRLIVIAAGVLALSSLNSFILYHLYLM